MRLNENITKLEQNYLFAEIAMRVRRHREEHPGAEILSLGINDVTRPLAPLIIVASAKSSLSGAGNAARYASSHGVPENAEVTDI